MSAELKRLVQRFYDEVLNAGQLNVLDELLTPNAIYRNPALGHPASVEEAKRRLAGLQSAFPVRGPFSMPIRGPDCLPFDTRGFSGG